MLLLYKRKAHTYKTLKFISCHLCINPILTRVTSIQAIQLFALHYPKAILVGGGGFRLMDYEICIFSALYSYWRWLL